MAALAVTVPWLLDAGGHGLPRRGAQLAVALGLAGLAGIAASTSWRLLRAELRASRWVGWGLLALGVLSVGVHFAGLSFEVGHGYYRDEGIYRAAAERINGGALLPLNFIYGHLPYYLAAWALWLHGLFLRPSTALIAALCGLRDEASVSWMCIRAIAGACGALTVLPVFGIARRVFGGTRGDEGEARLAPTPSFMASNGAAAFAGFLGAGLITASTLYNEVTHVYISDVPAAFFATLSLYFVARLAGEESRRDYVLAGVASGLAAGCKYPAGVVVVAILGVWLWWRWRLRAWSAGLLFAAAASLGAFLLVMPAFLVHARDAFAGQGRDVFFGVRQYADSGWIGVEKDSNASWYGSQLLDSFGVAALLLGLAGTLFLTRERRHRWLVLAIFPLAYGGLLSAMAMVVKRNLLPMLPVSAALLGAGAAGLAVMLAGRWPRWKTLAVLAVALAVLAVPTVAVVRQDLGLVLPGTRELAVNWISEHVPPGAGIVKESYTPRLEPGVYDLLQVRFAARVEPAEMFGGRYDFVLLADSAYGRFLDPENLRKEHQKIYAERYRRLLALPEAWSFDPGKTRLGPAFSLRRLDPAAILYRNGRDLAAAEAAFLSDPAMRPAGAAAIEYSAPGQWALFKDYLEAGRYEVGVAGEAIAGGGVRVVNRDNEPRAQIALGAAAGTLTVPVREKVFLYVELPPGGKLVRLTLRLLTP